MDADPCKVGTHQIKKARKTHICCECSQQIDMGESYAHFRGYWENLGWKTFKTCLYCDELRDELKDPDYGFPPFEQLGEWAQEAGVTFPVDTA